MTTPEEVTVRRFDAKGSELAVFEFQGELRDLILSNLRNDYLATGSYAADAKALSSQGVLSMAVAGAATVGTVLSASLSGRRRPNSRTVTPVSQLLPSDRPRPSSSHIALSPPTR